MLRITMKFETRKVKPTDLLNLAVLKMQVWISTYATEGIIEEYSSYVLSEFSIESVGKSIIDKDKLTLIATNEGRIIGCAEILIKPASPCPSVEPCPEITTLYVLERFQGLGVGKLLLAECINFLKELKFENIWLTVYFRNEKAIKFYSKQNFTQIGEMDFQLGNSKYKNHILMRKIQ